MIEKFTQWHKDRIECAASHFGISQYQLLWISAIKGIVFGYLVGVYL